MVDFSDDEEFPELEDRLEIRNNFISELGIEKIMRREGYIVMAPVNREMMREYAEQCMNFDSLGYKCLKQKGFFEEVGDFIDISSTYLNASILCFVGGLGASLSDNAMMGIGFYALSFGLLVGGVVNPYKYFNSSPRS
jgi:hypothetical protein